MRMQVSTAGLWFGSAYHLHYKENDNQMRLQMLLAIMLSGTRDCMSKHIHDKAILDRQEQGL